MSNNLPTVLIEGGIRDGPKYYCLRSMGQQTDCLNSSVLDCSVTFSVDKNICVIGVQVPTQVVLPGCEVSILMVELLIFFFGCTIYYFLIGQSDTQIC